MSFCDLLGDQLLGRFILFGCRQGLLREDGQPLLVDPPTPVRRRALHLDVAAALEPMRERALGSALQEPFGECAFRRCDQLWEDQRGRIADPLDRVLQLGIFRRAVQVDDVRNPGFFGGGVFGSKPEISSSLR